MGENSGVDGAERAALLTMLEPTPGRVIDLEEDAGNASHVDVTRRALSTARRYLPRYL